MKTIFDRSGIRYDRQRATLKDLLAIFVKNDFVPSYLQDYFNNLEKVLQGIGTVRSREGAHGGGSAPRDPDAHLVAFALHLAAANIIFVIECYKQASEIAHKAVS